MDIPREGDMDMKEMDIARDNMWCRGRDVDIDPYQEETSGVEGEKHKKTRIFFPIWSIIFSLIFNLYALWLWFFANWKRVFLAFLPFFHVGFFINSQILSQFWAPVFHFHPNYLNWSIIFCTFFVVRLFFTFLIILPIFLKLFYNFDFFGFFCLIFFNLLSDFFFPCPSHAFCQCCDWIRAHSRLSTNGLNPKP